MDSSSRNGFQSGNPQNIHKNVLLPFDESISLDAITANGIIFIIVLICLYILAIIWAIHKDKEKSVFAPNLQGKDLQLPAQTTNNIQQIDLDYTAETLDMTSVTTEEMRQYSNALNAQPSSGTPTGAVDRTRSFRFENEIQNSNARNHAQPVIQLQDDSIFRSTKREVGSDSKVPIKTKQTLCSKFRKLVWQRHILFSTNKRMSRISPRWKRVTLIFFLLVADLFISSWGFIDHSMKGNQIRCFVVSILVGWCAFGILARLSAISKDRLVSALSNENFQASLQNLEREGRIKSICLHSIVAIFAVLAFIQFGLFLSMLPKDSAAWLIMSSCSIHNTECFV